MTDELLDALARDIAPRPVRRVGPRLVLALGAGAFISLAGVLVLLGPRADYPAALTSAMFWTKLFYALTLAAVLFLPVVVLSPHNQCNCRCVMCDIWKIREPKRLHLRFWRLSAIRFVSLECDGWC